MTLRALVVEDEPLPRAQLEELLGALWPQLEISTAADGLEGLAQIQRDPPAVALIDIRLPGLDGIELARAVGGRCHVVFVTAHDDRTLAAFEQGAVDYVLKPVTAARLSVTVQRVQQRLAQPPADLSQVLARLAPAAPARLKWLQVGSATRQRLITVGDVFFFESDTKYTRVVLREGEELIRSSIRELTEQLDPDQFWQIHRSVIVNVARIAAVERELPARMTLQLHGRDERLVVSQRFQHVFKLM